MEKTCIKCGKIFKRVGRRSTTQWEKRLYCSKRCSATKRNVSDDIVIIKMYEDGITCVKIAKKFSTSDSNIRRILHKNNIKVKRRIQKGGLSITKDGYIRFNNTNSNGVNAGRRLHDIVAEMTIGRPLMKKEVVHHKDRDRLNNNPSNLKVMTRGEHSTLHSISSGRKIISSSDADEILYKNKFTKTSYSILAKEYNVSKSLISNIVKGRAHKYAKSM